MVEAPYRMEEEEAIFRIVTSCDSFPLINGCHACAGTILIKSPFLGLVGAVGSAYLAATNEGEAGEVRSEGLPNTLPADTMP